METISETNKTLQALSRDLADAVEGASSSVVAINARRHLSSSGVCWADDVVVTAGHTIRRTEDISVILPRGQTVPATLVGADPATDLAVLKIDTADLSPPPLLSAILYSSRWEISFSPSGVERRKVLTPR